MKIFHVEYYEQTETAYDGGKPILHDWEEKSRDVVAEDGEAAIAKVKKYVLAQTRSGSFEDVKTKFVEKCVGFKLLSLKLLAEADDE